MKVVTVLSEWNHSMCMLQICQWCTFLSISSHRSIKNSKTLIVPTPIRTLVRLKYSVGGLMSHCFYDAVDKWAVVLPPDSSFRSVQNTDVLTSSTRLQGHLILAEVSSHVYIVHGQSTSYFCRCKAEPNINSWSETTLRQPFQDWLSVVWTSTFHVLFTAMDFVFCKSGVLLFLHHQDTLLSKFGLQNTVSLSPKVLKSVQHWLCGIVAAMSKL